MKTQQYTSIEKKIAKSETGSIRERWLYGARLLDDPLATTEGGKSLKNGVAEQLIKFADHHGLKLSGREIQYRLQAARAYPTEGQFRKALAEFTTWWDLIQAGFPPYPIDPVNNEPADYRTPAEQNEDNARALLENHDLQLGLFPYRRFEPAETPLKDLIAYQEQQDAITASFIATGERRAKYLDELKKAVGNDLERSWLDAHMAAFGTDDVEATEPPTDVVILPAPIFNDNPELD